MRFCIVITKMSVSNRPFPGGGEWVVDSHRRKKWLLPMSRDEILEMYTGVDIKHHTHSCHRKEQGLTKGVKDYVYQG